MILLNFEELDKTKNEHGGVKDSMSYNNVDNENIKFKNTRENEDDFEKVGKELKNERHFVDGVDGEKGRSDHHEDLSRLRQHQRYNEDLNKGFQQNDDKNMKADHYRNLHRKKSYNKNRSAQQRVAEENGGGAINSLMRMLKGGEYAKHIFSNNRNKKRNKKKKNVRTKFKKTKKSKKINSEDTDIGEKSNRRVSGNKQQQQQQQQQQKKKHSQIRCIVPQLDPFNPEARPFIKYDYVGQKCPIRQVGTLKEGGILTVNLKNVQAAGYMYIKRVDDDRNVYPRYFPLTSNLITEGQ